MRSAVIHALVLFVSSRPAVVSAQSTNEGERLLVRADIFKNKSIPDSALHCLQKAAAFFEDKADVEKLIYSHNQAGILLTRLDRYEEAKRHLQIALMSAKKLSDTCHAEVARTCISLGVVYAAGEDYETSLYYHRAALDMRLRLSGKRHADVATSYGNIGNVYLRMKRPDEAIEAHLEAMNIRESLFGGKSKEIAESYFNLGRAYREKGLYDFALAYFEKTLENKLLQPGVKNRDLARYYEHIGEIYGLLNNPEKEKEFLRKASDLKGG